MKICMSFGAGGHRDQCMIIKEALNEHETVFLVSKNDANMDLKAISKTYYFRKGPSIEKFFIGYFFLFVYYIYLIFPSLKVILKEKPDVIFGNGGEATIFLSYFGKLIGIKIIYLESLSRIKDLSGTGKIVYPIADLFLVQWKNLQEKYPKAKYWGKVI